MISYAKTLIKRLQKNQIIFLLILILWFIVQLVLYKLYGINTNLEAIKYISNANSIIKTGSFIAPKYLLYSTYIYFLSFFLFLKLSYLQIIIIQILISGWALYRLFYLTNHLFNLRTAIIAALIFTLSFPIQSWNLMLYTESFFISIITIFASYLLLPRLSIKAKIIISIPFLILITFSRPTGALFIIPTLLYISSLYKKNWSKKRLYISIIIVALLFLAFLDWSLKYFDMLSPLLHGDIICGVSSLSAPAPLIIPQVSDKLLQLLLLFAYNFSYFSLLMVKRFISFFGMARPYYSLSHNILLYLFYPVYLFFIIGCLKLKVNRQLLFFILPAIVLFTSTTILSCDNWHGRFIVPILPFIIITAASGIDKILFRSYSN